MACIHNAKVLIAGIAGQLAFDVAKQLNTKGIEYVGSDIRVPDQGGWENFYQCDITNANEVKEMINSIRPDAVIHCAA